MRFDDDLNQCRSIFIDTAPLIYYIEAHPHYGSIMKEIINLIQTKAAFMSTSVITLAEVLPKPIQKGQAIVTEKFISFLRNEKTVHLIEISTEIAQQAGRLRGKYTSLKLMDAIQISAASDIGADIFLSNDKQLKKVSELKVIVLDDYL